MIKNNIKLAVTTVAVLITVIISGGAVNAVVANVLNFNADTTLTINSNNYTILNGSMATTMAVGATTLTVTVPDSQTFTLVSPTGYSLSGNGGVAESCSATHASVLTITGPDTLVITFDPNPVSCISPAQVVAPAPPVIGSGGGGGGGQAVTTPSTQQSSQNSSVTTGSNTGTSAQPQVDQLIASTTLGSTGDSVKSLQQHLKDLGFFPKTTNVTGYYGPVTQNAVKKYQASLQTSSSLTLGPITISKPLSQMSTSELMTVLVNLLAALKK